VAAGGLGVPISVSLTVAVHVVLSSCTGLDGLQETDVDVVRVSTVMSWEPLLGPQVSALGVKLAEIVVGLPVALGVYVTVQLEVALSTVVGEQVAAGENVPPVLEDRLTVPLGVLGLPAVSATVTVQLVCPATGSDVGEQDTDVEVVSATTIVVVVELAVSVALPP
jgi:hypothetical protein